MKHIYEDGEVMLVWKDTKKYKPTIRHLTDKIKSLDKNKNEWIARKERFLKNKGGLPFDDNWYDQSINYYQKMIDKCRKKIDELMDKKKKRGM